MEILYCDFVGEYKNVQHQKSSFYVMFNQSHSLRVHQGNKN